MSCRNNMGTHIARRSAASVVADVCRFFFKAIGDVLRRRGALQPTATALAPVKLGQGDFTRTWPAEYGHVVMCLKTKRRDDDIRQLVLDNERTLINFCGTCHTSQDDCGCEYGCDVAVEVT